MDLLVVSDGIPPTAVVFDCRHTLGDPAAGPAAFQAGHIPGAFHAHVDADLSGPIGDGSHGRHPLPSAAAFQSFLRAHGVGPATPVVAYDEGPGQWAARLWWLSRYFGHHKVALLDGGLAAWTAAGRPLETGVRARPGGGRFVARPGALPIMDAQAVADGVARRRLTLLDARAPERYRGEVEPIDPVAGHIPGAVNRPTTENLGPDGRFLAPATLRARFPAGGDVAVYCGSGVTACHDVFAMARAGLSIPALYPGSWSEWCRSRPAATGDAGVSLGQA